MKRRTLFVQATVQKSDLDVLGTVYKADIERETDSLVAKLRNLASRNQVLGWKPGDINVSMKGNTISARMELTRPDDA